ncbi:DUF1033 family protein [Solibacillus sp. FSL R7-0668]|uniref:DUF1033 family protein n=1 Tax=Solibacillus sp. FSL R7-0668 TaxID=2921688 RepID=UPI002F43E4B4
MYKIIYMKADYEPWWQFEGWEAFIVSEQIFETAEQFQEAYEGILENFRQQYDNEATKDERYYAFWSDDECEYCEACDDEAQVYHGIIVETP